MNQNSLPRVGIVIPTLNAGDTWAATLTAVEAQSITPARKLVIDSSSDDDTARIARDRAFEVLTIQRAEFNHGGTRQAAVRHLYDSDIIVLLTQDAILASPASIHSLINCFLDPSVAVAYGRQIPHLGATPIESHARFFNYDKESRRKDKAAISRFGSKSFFCSNSFAAYRRTTLLELGGFRSDLILAEDAEYAARAILAGYANQYCAEATVYHSHDYTVTQQFKRYFDLGVFQSRTPWLQNEFGSHAGEGLRFIRSELSYLSDRDKSSIPKALAETAAKILGYRLGKLERRLPTRLKRQLSMSHDYWK